MSCCFMSRYALFLPLLVFYLSAQTRAVIPANNTEVPPLQWIELSTTGSGPQGLSYASIGFDGTSQLIIFGGESNGVLQQQTFILDVSSLSWSTPVPPLAQAGSKPPARSMAISGGDFAASNRHGHVVIGGKGPNGPLSDAWEFDYINQFWTEISISAGGPSARYSASGGTDPTASAVSDPIVPGPNNTFYIAGGFDGTNALSLSDVWKFEVAGVLSSNNVGDVVGSWTQVKFSDTLPSRVRQGGTIMPSANVVAAGGCASADSSDNTCAQEDSHVLNVNTKTDLSPNGCIPRVGPVVVPNYNSFSSGFATQALMLLGTFNNTLWDDGNGLNQGEVDILETTNGVWTRVLPAGDPSSGKVKFPTPREGAAAFASSRALVGADPSVGSDILVFGGKDANGNDLSDLWLLRGYHGSLTKSNASWSGFGDGTLGSGPNATGAGVTVQYLTTCASALSPSATSGTSPTSTSTSTPASGSSPSSSPSDSQSTFPFDTQIGHKVSSPVSVALLLVSLAVYRMSMPSPAPGDSTSYHRGLVWLAGLTGLAAYVLGVAGLVFSFTTISSASGSALKKRSVPSSLLLKTNHGKVALAFFIIVYGLLPVLVGLSLFWRAKYTTPAVVQPDQRDEATRKDSDETNFTSLMTSGREKANLGNRAASSPDVTMLSKQPDATVRGPRTRVRSLFNGHLWPGYKRGRLSTDSGPAESLSTTGPSHSFEVVNRGNRSRRLSANGLNAYSSEGGHSIGHSAQPSMPRSLSDLNWLDRRRSVAAFGELDYALTQLNQAQPTTPMGDNRSTGPLLSIPNVQPRPTLPSKLMSFLHILLHAAILGIIVVVLVQLWQRAPKATFIVFLLWSVAFYCLLLFLAWRGTPRASILSVLLSSLRYQPVPPQSTVPYSTASSRPMSRNEQYAFPSESRSPYTFHQPLFRRAASAQDDEYLTSNGHGGPRSDEDEEDEETAQRRMEQEMDRRDVSIVTVPKRKLWIANPS